MGPATDQHAPSQRQPSFHSRSARLQRLGAAHRSAYQPMGWPSDVGTRSSLGMPLAAVDHKRQWLVRMTRMLLLLAGLMAFNIWLLWRRG